MIEMEQRLTAVNEALKACNIRPSFGRVTGLKGPVLYADFAQLGLGSICEVDRIGRKPLMAEVIGIEGTQVILSPFGALDGISAGTPVRASDKVLRIPTGAAVLGRIVDPYGVPIDGLGELPEGCDERAIKSGAPTVMDRPIIDTPLSVGLRAIDGPLTVGAGQRIAVFGPPGTGKSTLLASIARHTSADVIVIGLVGERGREVREFAERDLPQDARDKVVMVVATSDRPAVERAICALSATAIAEGFRDEGKSVLLLIDSLTRTARALREVGLAAGEAPARRGFPASVYPALPAIIERAGRTKTGDITALYTVLSEGDGQLDPIAEEVKSLTDGHFVLSRKLAEAGQFPAIDVLQSLSRSMNSIVEDGHRDAATQLRAHLSKFQSIELLLQIGEYEHGGDADADMAIAAMPHIKQYLGQGIHELSTLSSAVRGLEYIAE